jgi:hypothetical protein
MKKQYNTTAHGLMMWAQGELEHVGRIAAVSDKDIQYSYAQSTLYGMAHLKDAIYQYVNKFPQCPMKYDLLTAHDQVIRVMQHLKDEYYLNLDDIRAFNTRKVLTPFTYLKNKRSKKTRKQRK